MLSVESFREVIRPLRRALGEPLAAVFGVTEDLATRLQRTIRRSTSSVPSPPAGLERPASCGRCALSARPPALVALFFILGGPLLAFLVVEQQVASGLERWKRRLLVELPVVAEQLAMLLAAGYSLGAALNRPAARARGAAATDLSRV